MGEIKLRDYQWQAVRFTVDELQGGASAVAVVAPTGAGKTTIITSILHKMPGLRSAFVAAPQKSIERGFLTDATFIAPAPQFAGSVSAPIIGRGSQYVPLRDERDKDDKAQTLLAGVRPGVDKWGLTTHSQLCNWGTEFLPDNLTGHLLVLDEAHHAGSSDEEKRIVTRLGEVADTWRERGGKVLYVTATPYRSDGERVLPEGTTPWTWTIADHAASGFAPANFHLRTVSSGIEVSTPAEYAGDALPTQEEDGGEGYRMMVDRWIEDGRPKSVFIVPARDSVGWATRLERALVDAGARVCNAVGTDAAADERFSTALDAERAAGSFAASSTDVFIACKRFDEGTDWPLCSHVYNWGVPASFGLIIQRWGRTFRDKSRYPDYPEATKQIAQLTFFIPRVAEDARDQFSNHHHEHAWLLGTYLADWETGREYKAAMRLRLERAWARRPHGVAGSTEQDDVKDLFGNLLNEESDDTEQVRMTQAATLPDHVRAEATAFIGQVEVAIGGEPTVRDIVNHIEALGVDPEMMAAVREVIAERVAGIDAGAGDLVDRGLDRIVSSGSPLKDVVRRELADLYRSVIDQFGDRTVPIAGAAMAYATQFTGDDAKVVADRLRRALNKPDLTVDMLIAAIVKYRDANGGRNPSGGSGDASPHFGYAETWNAVNQRLYSGGRGFPGGSSLAKFLVEHGFSDDGDITTDNVKTAIIKYRDANGGRNPSLKSGDATPHFGSKMTWAAVNETIRNGRRGFSGGSSLAKFLIEHGFASADVDLTAEMLIAAIIKYRDANGGRNPSVMSGDATPHFGSKMTWAAVNQRLEKGWPGFSGGSSLAKFLVEHGFGRGLTVEIVKAAIVKYRNANGGRNPTVTSGDATPYVGNTVTWRGVNSSLREGCRGLPGGSSLARFLVEHGFDEDKPDITDAELETACRAFHTEHGTYPKVDSGDCSRYFGWAEGTDTWRNVNACIRNGIRGLGSLNERSLYLFCQRLGIADVKPKFTDVSLKSACLAYHAEHGTYPKEDSGDCSKHFGWSDGTDTWANVNSSIANGSRGLESLKGSSLYLFCQDLGIATVKPDFTPDLVEKACRTYFEEHGKHPRTKREDCSRYFGRPDGTETWLGVDGCIREGNRGLKSLKGSSLYQFCQDIGIATVKPDLTVDGLEKACRAFHAEHGTYPKVKSGDCSRYFGRPDGIDTWMNVNACINHGNRGLESLKGSSLVQVCKEWGLVR
jgi:hypothetical protein